LKKLRGTDQPCRINHDEPEGEKITKLPHPPSWFSKLAKSIYKNKGMELINMDLLTKIDLDMFVSYCVEYATYLETSEQISKIPAMALLDAQSELLFQRLNKQKSSSWERAKAIATQFGFTPSSRASLKLAPKEKKDDLETFLGL